ncbi:MAG TPA: restriction endonuclease, partial [Polyangia bacterium]
ASPATEGEGEGEGEEAAAGAEEGAPAVPQELPLEAAAAGTPREEVAELEAAAEEAELLDEGAALDEGDEDDELVEEIDEHTGPLLAPALGAEDVMRTEDDRTVRPEIRGSRDERRHHRGDRHKDRRDRHRKGGGGPEHKAHEPRAHEPRPHEPRAHDHKAHEPRVHEPRVHEPRAHEHKAHEPRPSQEPRTGGLVDTLLELLRASDGRPMHVRHLVDAALKRRALDDKTQPGDLVRLARAALVREQRDREADGLRPRVRALGGGHYGTVDKKLDPELQQAERELGSSAGRLRDATRAAVRRRLGRMAPAAFDALGRTLADKLGVTGLELLRRGEGVTYWGGSWARGVATARVLVALRPGEGEINRRAVGELRAGLAAKGYDEGLLLAAGRPNAEALAELKQGGVALYDGAALASLLVKHGLGVRRVAMPVDYLDLDFFGELTEG